MKNPIMLKGMVDKEEAMELVDYLYCEKIAYTEHSKDSFGNDCVLWHDNQGEVIAKWTETFRNIMVSKDIIE